MNECVYAYSPPAVFEDRQGATANLEQVCIEMTTFSPDGVSEANSVYSPPPSTEPTPRDHAADERKKKKKKRNTHAARVLKQCKEREVKRKRKANENNNERDDAGPTLEENTGKPISKEDEDTYTPRQLSSTKG